MGYFMAIFMLSMFMIALFLSMFEREIAHIIDAKADELRARAEKIRKETEENDSSN